MLMPTQNSVAPPIDKLRITVLVENQAGRPELAVEKGLSLLVEDGVSKVLFDTGKLNAFWDNAATLGHNLQDLSHVVLSHGHYDHVGGVAALAKHLATVERKRRPLLVAHPESFAQRGLHVSLFGHAFRLRNLGSKLSRMEVEARFPCSFHRRPFWLHRNLVFLGEIPRRAELGKAVTFGSLLQKGKLQTDHIVDDSALAYCTNKGLVILAGCAHSGICNIIEYARKVTGETRVHGVIGGFHLHSASQSAISEVADYFTAAKIHVVHGCHCTGRAVRRLPNQIDIQTGSILEI